MGESNRVRNTFEVPFAQRTVVILGAGIIGCATARQLLQHGFSVVLVAEFLPGDQDIYYASAWAGAAWHAAGGITADQRYYQAVTHRVLLKMAQDPESGVSVVDAREYLEQEPAPDSAVWGKTVVSKFRELDPTEYPSNFNCGWAYRTLVTDPTRHMPYLGKRITALGGKFIRRRVESLHELYEMFPDSRVFINASGLGSKTLADVQDDRCFPERGQNVFLRTHRCNTLYFRNGKEYTYVIPRPLSQGVVLGGVKERDNLSPEVDLDIARDEIARAHRLAPDIVPEHPADDVGCRTLLSAYGFGGGGYAFSYGVADALLKMVEQAERRNVIV
ncbi:uncharacterized protein N7498_001784 [Penicillium cinerascens]|uniref:FAD dependent oxidoreductase domain-containing protein n=1 Tax=Penicillium cinerascens TaxID=70096 RepID=A0A9W9N8X0_9EURO|nr:uncharacterized protein N7498_001784 [Penicillium cinerascens]KAJ5215377.1 hypothetical protein N7498_001784 [Penicillium cinerascens]